ncbi:MAG: hypothetical protein JSW04_08465 [Desulfobacterales bacterium]|nr:MAG: hypothetical protein JSW04_08465 [Desulfobacterales bacterium]
MTDLQGLLSVIDLSIKLSIAKSEIKGATGRDLVGDEKILTIDLTCKDPLVFTLISHKD